ncbi:MAG: chemotaxis protein CheD [Spirochaetota bacterium]|nr:chemotaxis protein CheD [Spirochaetota bacterium]
MYTKKSLKYGKNIQVILPGEFYVSNNDEMISTLLGSCVSVCLHDPIKRISGMNHFMLPGRMRNKNNDIFFDRSAKYGIIAINELFSEIMKYGSEKRNLIAKVFGGGHVLKVGINNVPSDNVRLAKVVLEMEDVPIVEEDVGDIFTRKIIMDVHTGNIFLKKLAGKSVYENVYKREIDFKRSRYWDYEYNKGLDS